MFYEIMAQNPEKLKKFQTVLEHMEKRKPVDAFYDFGQLSTSDARPVLVDVGGGTGKIIKEIMRMHPELAKTPEKFVLQDMAETIEHARLSENLVQGVQTMTHDFYKEQPVKGSFSLLLWSSFSVPRKELHQIAKQGPNY